MSKKKMKAEAWTEAKKRCRLNEADIKMAKELGMTPKSLIKNIPSPNQRWKAPVKYWIHDLYESKFGKVLQVEKKKGQKVIHRSEKSMVNRSKNNNIFSQYHINYEEEDLPF